MVFLLKNTKSILPRLYEDCVYYVEEISLIEETYLWRNVRVYIEDPSTMEEFLVLHSQSFNSGERSLSAYMTAIQTSTIRRFSDLLERKRGYRTHLQTSAPASRIESFMPWLSKKYVVRYLRADSSTFKPDYKHQTGVVRLTPSNVAELDSTVSDLFVKRIETAPVYGYLNQKRKLVATSGVGWLTKTSFSISYTETRPRYRRRGIAKCLTSFSSEPLIKKGLIGVYASDVTNKPSLKVGLGLGFRPYRDINCFYS